MLPTFYIVPAALIVIIVLSFAIAAIKGLPSSRTGLRQFRAKPALLTENERQFFGVLQTVIGADRVVFTQVRIADFISSTSDGVRGLHRITSRSVDFVVCDRLSMAVIGCIELDDRSHSKRKRVERDRDVNAILGACGIPLIRIPAKSNNVGYTATSLVSKLTFLESSSNQGGS